MELFWLNNKWYHFYIPLAGNLCSSWFHLPESINSFCNLLYRWYVHMFLHGKCKQVGKHWNLRTCSFTNHHPPHTLSLTTRSATQVSFPSRTHCRREIDSVTRADLRLLYMCVSPTNSQQTCKRRRTSWGPGAHFWQMIEKSMTWGVCCVF